MHFENVAILKSIDLDALQPVGQTTEVTESAEATQAADAVAARGVANEVSNGTVPDGRIEHPGNVSVNETVRVDDVDVRSVEPVTDDATGDVTMRVDQTVIVSVCVDDVNIDAAVRTVNADETAAAVRR
jgi:hypothetical protein